MRYDAIVLGGGIYGTHVALKLRAMQLKVALFEPNELLSGATSVNQGRVHEGFHYPRSASTAMTARRYYEQFLIDFAPAISSNKRHLYLIAEDSKVSPDEYEKVLDEIGAEYKKVETPKFFTSGRIQQAYETHEVAFNVKKLRELLTLQLRWSGVDIIKDYGVIGSHGDGSIFVRPSSSREDIQTNYIFNCTYASVDKVVSGYRTKLRKEYVEVVRLWVAGCNPLLSQDLTLMNGAFWSLMHYPGHGQEMLLTHVKHGRHEIWTTPDPQPKIEPVSKASLMTADMLSYCQGDYVDRCSYVGSLYTIRTLVADTMGDDSRPVVVEYAKETPRIVSILGSKFNSIYDLDEFLKTGEWAR